MSAPSEAESEGTPVTPPRQVKKVKYADQEHLDSALKKGKKRSNESASDLESQEDEPELQYDSEPEEPLVRKSGVMPSDSEPDHPKRKLKSAIQGKSKVLQSGKVKPQAHSTPYVPPPVKKSKKDRNTEQPQEEFDDVREEAGNLNSPIEISDAETERQEQTPQQSKQILKNLLSSCHILGEFECDPALLKSLPEEQMLRPVNQNWVATVAKSIQNNMNNAVAPLIAMTAGPVKQSPMTSVRISHTCTDL